MWCQERTQSVVEASVVEPSSPDCGRPSAFCPSPCRKMFHLPSVWLAVLMARDVHRLRWASVRQRLVAVRPLVEQRRPSERRQRCRFRHPSGRSSTCPRSSGLVARGHLHVRVGPAAVMDSTSLLNLMIDAHLTGRGRSRRRSEHSLFLPTTVSECLRTGLGAKRPTLFRRQNLMSRTSIAANSSPTNFPMGECLATDRSPRMTTTRT